MLFVDSNSYIEQIQNTLTTAGYPPPVIVDRFVQYPGPLITVNKITRTIEIQFCKVFDSKLNIIRDQMTPKLLQCYAEVLKEHQYFVEIHNGVLFVFI